MKCYAIVVPVIESELILHKFGGENYTLLECWDDLLELNGKLLSKAFKIFVDQKEISQPPRFRFPPKLFILTFLKSKSRETAYQEGMNKIRDLVYTLVILFRTGFRILEHETITVELPKSEPSNVANAELSIENGKVKEILVHHPNFCEKWTIHPPYFGRADHEKYVTKYFKIPKLEGPVKLNLGLMSKKTFSNVDKFITNFGTLKPQEQRFLKTLSFLYSTAVSVDDIFISHLLLWNMLEVMGRTEETYNQLIDVATIQEIQHILHRRGYEKRDIQRITSILGQITKETPVMKISEFIKKHIPSEKIPSDIESLIKKARELRNRIVHPKPDEKLQIDELCETYYKIREILDEIFFEFRKKILGNT